MIKIDLKREFKHLYNTSTKETAIVDVPAMNFLMVDGVGNPNVSQEYKDAVEGLYAVSYDLKFTIKKGEIAVDYGVMPLEGLWWVGDMSQFSVEIKDKWEWTAMIMQPEYITEEFVHKSIEQVSKNKNLEALTKIRFESYHEGLSSQIMHIGSYSDEGSTIERLHSFIEENGYELIGKHHEIYLSDLRRSAPDKMKTIIRQPMKEKKTR